jgi:hypothetical protein
MAKLPFAPGLFPLAGRLLEKWSVVPWDEKYGIESMLPAVDWV